MLTTTTECNYMEFLPPGFSPDQKHPVLFQVYVFLPFALQEWDQEKDLWCCSLTICSLDYLYSYGGPGSQLVDTKFQLGFSAVMTTVEKLKYVVVIVDGRGTGHRGRTFRISVVNQLGKLETEDQIAAAKHWKTLSYVDADRVAIWGWVSDQLFCLDDSILLLRC